MKCLGIDRDDGNFCKIERGTSSGVAEVPSIEKE